MLVVFALLAMLSALVIVSVEPILGRQDARRFDESLVFAAQEARFFAAQRKEPTRLVFLPPEASFQVQTADGDPLATVPTRFTHVIDDIELTWYLQLPAQGTDDANPRQSRIVTAVYFSPDQSASPFSANWTIKGSTETLTIDPFTGLPAPDKEGR